MPKVPPSGVLPGPGLLDPPSPTTFMLAAADMHANGRLFEPPPAEPTTPPAATAVEAFDPFRTRTKAKDQTRHRAGYPIAGGGN